MYRWVIKNELYHYGIKGMKWRKHKKKTNELESLGRTFESANRHYLDVYEQSRREFLKSDQSPEAGDKHYERMASAEKARHGSTINLWNKTGQYPYTSTGKHVQPRYDQKDLKGREARFTTVSEQRAIDAAKKKTHKKVKAYERKQKAKSFIKNLFGKNKSKKKSRIRSEHHTYLEKG